MHLSLRSASLSCALAFVASSAIGCAGMMFPRPGAVAPGVPAAPVSAAPRAPTAAPAADAPEANDCITETPCNWDSDCPSGLHCNAAMNRCFDPSPVASTLLTCNLNACHWDSECPASWSCNTATSHCQLR